MRPFRPSKSFYSECDKEPVKGVRQGRNMVFAVFQWYELMALAEMNTSGD